MATPKDGGPAFPGRDFETRPFSRGMTLRDYFAGQAVAALVHDEVSHCPQGRNADGTAIARRAYAVADAMLAEREKERR